VTDLVILVPVLGRPQNVAPLMDSIEESTPGARTLFLCDTDDDAELEAIEADGRGRWDVCGGSYAAKINRGIVLTSEPLIFIGADDLRFQPGWLEAARGQIVAADAQVVGVNDLIERPHRPQHATHFLVTRDYATRGQMDGEKGLLCERYTHSCVDDELIATATKRGVYAYAADSHVEHLHPIAKTAPMDDTYRRSLATVTPDRRIFRKRSPLWTS
jgi:hypothetical protein